MHKELKTILYDAENHYLDKSELQVFKQHITSVKERLETYKMLRDAEIPIFQSVADELEKNFSHEEPLVIKQALKHWILVLRYCAMAMLLNNPEFLERRLLEWLAPMVQVHKSESLSKALSQLLVTKLKQILSSEQFALINPFLEQAQKTITNVQVAKR